ncbi:twin-arginine translocase subunit TatC [Sandaracinobacteroides hominis]|uniref:twin-arginine translocase subunit TatC n=1 Tax=Sandaracinobacteroides hominis TaxID=2780086 RepID=UPI0018F5AC32|nr:twin-arginine translocase subunit TatC [Sandaracinobacteroides hominis]
MKDIDDSKAPLIDHLIELRTRLLWSVGAILIAFFVCFFFAKDIFALLVRPLAAAGQNRVIFTQVFEAFFVQVRVAFFGALMLSFPIVATQLWRFVAPGLYRQEKQAMLPFLAATPFLFALGASFAYFVAIPTALRFLLGFQGDLGNSGVSQEALPSVGQYLSFIMQFLFAFGLAFLLPVLLMLLNRAGILSRDQLVGFRRYFIVAAFVIAAVFTPPDVVSQLLLAIPLILLYEISLIAIRITERPKSAETLPAEIEKPAE